MKVTKSTRVIATVIVLAVIGVVAYHVFFDNPKPSRIASLVGDKPPIFQYVVPTPTTPVLMDSLLDSQYRLKSMRFLGIDSLKQAYYEIAYEKK